MEITKIDAVERRGESVNVSARQSASGITGEIVFQMTLPRPVAVELLAGLAKVIALSAPAAAAEVDGIGGS
jgi:hypothetical protein